VPDRELCIQLHKIIEEIDKKMVENANEKYELIKYQPSQRREEYMQFLSGENSGLLYAKAIIAELFPECFR